MKLFLIALLGALSLVAQTPTPKPQPADAVYGVDQLTLLPTYTRDSYETTFGRQAPPFDPSRAPKNWFDQTAKFGPNTYNSFDGTKFSTFTLNGNEAGLVNLPGLPHYDRYEPPAGNIRVVYNNGSFPSQLLGQGLQARRDDALALLAEIGDPSLKLTKQSGLGGVLSYVRIDPSVDVDVYYVGGMNAGAAWAGRNAKGVGYPGHWEKAYEGSYTWVNDVLDDGSKNTKPPVPQPVRALLPNEKLGNCSTNPMFPSACIVRTDIQPPAPAPSSGSFTQTDRDALNQILKLLKQLLGQ